MTENQDLKDFIGLIIGELKSEVTRLSGVVKEQSILIREIEIKSITGVSNLQKDIEDIRKDVIEIKIEQDKMGESQKLKWKTLTEQREARDREQAEKEQKQAVINSAMSTIFKLLWAILLIVLSIGIGFVWSLIVSGGIKGLVP
jgi:hypothetical protein